jgi:hypothetical protein
LPTPISQIKRSFSFVFILLLVGSSDFTKENLLNSNKHAEETDCGIVAPKYFRPTKNGKKEFFVISGIDAFPTVELLVVTRWGRKMFYSNNYKNDWYGLKSTRSGQIKASYCRPDIYFYQVTVKGNSYHPCNNKMFRDYFIIP